VNPPPSRDARTSIGRATSSDLAALLDIHAVAQILSCSARHVRRLDEAGRMPSPLRLGSLVRWRRVVIEQWIADGCIPPVEERR
jgi:predicted DNA-binding transcriptional regulator AlpA